MRTGLVQLPDCVISVKMINISRRSVPVMKVIPFDAHLDIKWHQKHKVELLQF